MIEIEKLSWSFPQKDLFTDITFTIEDGRHCALIGSNGIGKSTLLELIAYPEKYIIHHGKIKKNPGCRTGFVRQLVNIEKDSNCTVFDYLSSDFEAAQEKINQACLEMESKENATAAIEKYQFLLDAFEAIDGYDYEQNIRKDLALAGLSYLEKLPISSVSGGEYKLILIIREMLQMPDLLIMDEPDAFLDFNNIAGLGKLINEYKGTVLMATHNRFLLTRCFDQILHIENEGLRSFDGTYNEYRLWLLQMKANAMRLSDKETDWIQIQEQLVEKLRDNTKKVIDPYKGKLLRARVSYLERLKKAHIERPYLEIREPDIRLPNLEEQPLADPILSVENYSVCFEEELLNKVSFSLNFGEKLALIGKNGSGKSTLLKDVYKNENADIHLTDGVELGLLSQFYGEILQENLTVLEQLQEEGIESREEICRLLLRAGLEEACLNQKVASLSGGEKNLLQLLILSLGKANLLLLDEPSSHLDLPAQFALEKAIRNYKGAVLMISHDYYSIANCADAVLLLENGTLRRMSGRAFRKMFYKNYYRVEVLDLDQKKAELEKKISIALEKNDTALAEQLCEDLETVIGRIKE